MRVEVAIISDILQDYLIRQILFLSGKSQRILITCGIGNHAKVKLEKDNILSPILREFSKFSNLGLCLSFTQIISGFPGRKYLGGRLGMD